MVRHRDTEINSNLIIEHVKFRPCLYESNHPNFGDRAEKSRAWEEVCQAVVPMWCSMASEDRFAAGKEVQKRWRSIRDSYTKAYRQGKCVLPENCPPASRRYQYHQQMSFLLLALQNKKPRYSHEKHEPSISDVSNSPRHMSAEDEKQKNDSPKSTLTNHRPQTRENSSEMTVDNETTIETRSPSFEIKIDATTVMSHDHFYDDEQFMNSLLPFFKNMSDTTRLLCRIEILKIIHSALNKLSSEASSQTTTNMSEDRRERCSVNKNESTLTMTTRSADGSRPVRKRCSNSPPVAVVPPKKRGPGRPRKIRPPTTGEPEQPKTPKVTEKPKTTKLSGESKPLNVSEDTKTPRDCDEIKATRNRGPQLKVAPVEVPNTVEMEESLNKATTVVNMSIPLFMKIYNLKHTTLSPEPKTLSIKEEQPVD